MPQYWIGVASKEHAQEDVERGVSQFHHGELKPALRLKKGDRVIIYSPWISHIEKDAFHKFTAIGIVQDDEPHQVEQKPGFKPYRHNVQYFDSSEVDIHTLLPDLPFIPDKKRWGMKFRYGLLEIDQKSFTVIAKAMLSEKDFKRIVSYT